MDKLSAIVSQLTSLTVSLIVLGVAAGVVFGDRSIRRRVLDKHVDWYRLLVMQVSWTACCWILMSNACD